MGWDDPHRPRVEGVAFIVQATWKTDDGIVYSTPEEIEDFRHNAKLRARELLRLGRERGLPAFQVTLYERKWGGPSDGTSKDRVWLGPGIQRDEDQPDHAETVQPTITEQGVYELSE